MKKIKVILKKELRKELKGNFIDEADYYFKEETGNSAFFEFFEIRKEKSDRVVCMINVDYVLFIGLEK